MQTVKYDRTQYERDWVARHHSYEVKYAKVFYKALKAQVQPVIDHVKLYGGISKDVADLLVKKAPMEIAYEDCYTTIGTLSAQWNMRRINSLGKSVKALPQFLNDLWRGLMSKFYTTEAADRVSDVTETTREKIRQVLDEADDMNLTISERATYIEEQLSDPDFNRARSLVIARTESTLAANKGASLGNASANYRTVKEWLAVEDKNTRPTHRIADGQIVENDADFTVGGELAQFPGDTRLSAKEVIQCRCTAVYVPVLGADGLPILK